MRSSFNGYYTPTDEEFQKLWKEGTIVLDTNVLLDLYRLPASARSELLSVLEIVKDRIWIPYQVALEFQRRRLNVIFSERKVTEDTLANSTALLSNMQKDVEALQIEKRGLQIETAEILVEFKKAHQKLVDALTKVHEAQQDIASIDPIRDRLDTLLLGRVGPAPRDQESLDQLSTGGEDRYLNKIPPGWGDSDKEKNPNEAIFWHDGVSYERKYGDLYLWRQLIDHAKSNGLTAVLMVTSDRKEDWWWREKGKTIGPRPELAREIAQLAGTELFWMYSADQFLKNSKSFMKADVSDASVSELAHVTRNDPPRNLATSSWLQFAGRPGHVTRPNPFNYSRLQKAFSEWLRERFSQVIPTQTFPDFIVSEGKNLHGYETRTLGNPSSPGRTSSILNTMRKGRLAVVDGNLGGFTLVIVLEESEYTNIFASDKSTKFNAWLDGLLGEVSINGIIAGYVDDNGAFLSVAHRLGKEMQAQDNAHGMGTLF